MKNLLLLIVLFSIKSVIAQENIQLPDCKTAKQSGVDKKTMMQGMKGNLNLPKELYTEKVAVILKYDNLENVKNLIAGGIDDSKSIDFKEMISPVTNWIEESGLNVHSFIFTETDLDVTNQHHYNRTDEKQDLENFKKNGVKYLILVSLADTKGLYEKSEPRDDRFFTQTEGPKTFDYSKSESGSFHVDIHSLSESKVEIYSTNLHDLANNEQASSSSYVEAELQDRVGENATYKYLNLQPSFFKDKEIYFVLHPNLLMPKSKPKGLMCKTIVSSYQGLQKKNTETNGIFRKNFNDSDLNTHLVDKKSEIPEDEDAYILDIYTDHAEFLMVNYDYPHKDDKVDQRDSFYYYLINNKTQEIYLFNKSSFSKEHLLTELLNEIKK